MNDTVGNDVKFIEVISNKGESLFSIKIKETPFDTFDTDGSKVSKHSPGKANSNAVKDDIMSYAQKRYLFRLLAEQGFEGDQAHEYLKKKFRVNNLQDVTKFEASQVIEKLLEGQKGGDGHEALK